MGETRAALEAAGFSEIAVIDAKADLNIYKGAGGADMCCAPAATTQPASCCAPAPQAKTVSCCGAGPSVSEDLEPSFHDGVSDFFRDVDLNAYAASVKIFAVKPR